MSKAIIKKISSFLSEAPIGEFERIGDFSKRSSIRHDVDRKLLSSPKAEAKIRRIWQKTPITFNMMFVNLPKVNKPEYREVGEVNLDYVENLLGPEIADKIDPGACTIIFTNNAGDERVMATGWILAHRLGHAIAATGRSGSKSNLKEDWKMYTRELTRIFTDILENVYDISIKTGLGYGTQESDKILRLAAEQLGTMKSARDANLRNWYEFAYEVFAQYLLYGKIKLNPLPEKLLVNVGAFGRKDYRRSKDEDLREIYSRDLEYYEEELESILDNLIHSLEGKIFVM